MYGVIREDVRGLSPKEIKRLERERQLDDEAVALKLADLEDALARRRAQESEEATEEAMMAGRAAYAEHSAPLVKEMQINQGIADREELRYLRRKGRLSPEERGRKMELEAQLKKDRKDRLKSVDLAGAGLDDLVLECLLCLHHLALHLLGLLHQPGNSAFHHLACLA
jgi:hypothetical protein